MKKNNNIIFDITTLNKWNRPPVGIIRTQLEFAEYLLKNNKADFFIFNETKDAIIKVCEADVAKIVYRLRNFSNDKTPMKNKEKIRIVIKKLFNINYKNTIFHYTKILLKKFLPNKVINFIKKHKHKLRKTTISSFSFSDVNQITFSPEIYIANSQNISFIDNNSIVVSIGLDWDNSNYPLLYWLKRKIGFKFIGVFYDGISILYPDLVQSEYFSKRFFLHIYYLLYLSDKIFCISDFSKKQLQDIIEEHHFSNKPLLKTIHLGDSIHEGKSYKNISKNRKHKLNYVVYVSTIEVRKNHILLLKVWSYLIKKYGSENIPDLVCVGMFGWGIDELMNYYNQEKELKNTVWFYNDVDDIELEYIYQNASFTVFPSFIEGWGLGAVESLLYKKPCIISDCPALIEATRGLMPSISPHNLEEWCDTVDNWINNPEKIDYYIDIINKYFICRNWESFCSDFVDFIEEE